MDHLLLNVLILLLGVFLYFIIFFNQKFEQKYRQLIIFSICTVGIIVCMTFPFYDVNGYMYDLRLIPFMFGALYSGGKVAITLFLVMLSYHFMIGCSGLSAPMLQSFALLLLTLYMNFEFSLRPFRKKVLTTFLITAILSITTVLFYFILLPNIIDEYLLKVLLNYSLILIITASVIVYIIEFILQNKKIGSEIIEAEKLRVVSELAASVSHEVRNPLTVTRGFIQLLYDPNIDKQKKEEFLNLSLQELDRAQEIISEYLAFAKPLEKSNFILLNVKAELFYIIQVMSPLADMLEITLKNEVVVEGFIKGEKQKFRQCLINLLKNSIEATTTGGEIVISASCTNDKVTISIKDFGVGMSRTQLASLGSPYHSTKEKGTGLGTVVVFTMVKEMDGVVEVESEERKGTTFSLIFPRVTE